MYYIFSMNRFLNVFKKRLSYRFKSFIFAVFSIGHHINHD